MQSRPVAQLAQKIRTMKRLGYSSRQIARQLHLLTPDGDPNPGLAHDIAFNGYMPSDDVVWRLIRDGALPKPARVIVRLDEVTRKALLRALTRGEPLPPPTAEVQRKFDKWLSTRPRPRDQR